MESRRERRVQAVVLSVFAVAAGAETAAFLGRATALREEYVAAALLVVLVALCRLFPLHIGYKRKMITDSAPLLTAALLLQPWLAGAVAGAGMAAAELLQRGRDRQLKQLVFNSSQRLLSVVAGAAIYHTFADGTLRDPNASEFIATGLTIAALFVVTDVLLLCVVTAQLGVTVVRDWFRDRGDIPYDLALYASGFAAAFIASFHLWLIPLLVFPIAVFHRALRQQVVLRVQTRDAVEALADVVDMRDQYTFEHSKRVAIMSRGICQELGLSQDISDEIVAAARVHDVGKIGVRDAVLLKPDRLTETEFGEIKQHPDIGARLTARFPDFSRGTAYIRHHHEKFDGSGYPLGLKREAIPLGARIIAVADTYDAITSTRVYRQARSEEFARLEMARVAGSQLDPDVIDAFFRHKQWLPREEPAPAAVPSLAASPATTH
jgi:HD-GYP domain-containing protein (c-di-GMP phosphodiesterase class II)